MTFNKIFFSYIFCAFISVAFIPTTQAAISKQFNIYKKYIKEISRCVDVDCYIKVVIKYGSEDTIITLSKSADEFIQKTFELEKKKAISRRKKNNIYVIEEIVEGDKALLRLASKTYRALNETLYFVMEDGKWKIGKEGKKSEEDKGDKKGKNSVKNGSD